MAEFLNEQADELMRYDEQQVRRLIDKKMVLDDKVTVEFKFSVEIDIKL